MTGLAARADTVRADVCVIGAGPAGLTLAHELLGSGLQVLVLEAGPARPPGGGVDVHTTVNVGLPYAPDTTRSSGVGGSSLRWDVETPLGSCFVRLKELDELDFGSRPEVGSAGWPLSRSTLEPHYRRARDLLGLGPADDGRDTHVHTGVERRSYSFAAAATFTSRIPELLAADRSVDVRPDCVVTELRSDEAVVTAAECRDSTGAPFRVQARLYVLAGGAIENARLLLASRSSTPAGLGNTHDQVGRHFMEHPHYTSGFVVPPRGATGPVPACGLDVVDGHVRQDKFAVAPAVLRREGLLNAAYKVKPVDRTKDLGFGQDGRVDQATLDAYFAARLAWQRRRPHRLGAPHVVRLAAAAPDLARHALQRSARRSSTGRATHPSRVMVMGEQEPSPHSRVRLSSIPDRFGVPLAELDWRLTELDRTSMVRGQQLVSAGLSVAVGGRVISTLGPEGIPTPEGGAHHMGTTRMSRTPSSGVVDEHCQVHGVRNLYVAGSSVFPTGGAANPTLTIVALASRLAGRVVRELRPTVLRPG